MLINVPLRSAICSLQANTNEHSCQPQGGLWSHSQLLVVSTGRRAANCRPAGHRAAYLGPIAVALDSPAHKLRYFNHVAIYQPAESLASRASERLEALPQSGPLEADDSARNRDQLSGRALECGVSSAGKCVRRRVSCESFAIGRQGEWRRRVATRGCTTPANAIG